MVRADRLVDLSDRACETDEKGMDSSSSVRSGCVWIALLVALQVASSTASAVPPTSERTPIQVPSETIGLTPRDQMVDDQGALDVSLRRVEPGLGLPSGYRHVYALSQGGLMRANGGLAAVFPKSIYVQTREGVIPDVPAGTRFVIGGLPMGEEAGHGQLLAVDPMRPDALPVSKPTSELVPGRPSSGVGFGPGYRVRRSAAPTFEGGLARFQLDETYRRLRLRRLVANASPSAPSTDDVVDDR